MISAGRGFAQTGGGMPTYYEGLSQGLSNLDEVDSLVAFVPPDTDALRLPDSPKLTAVVCRGLRGGRAGRVAYEQLRLPALARRNAVNVLLSTVNVKPFTWHGPSVVVLQSMQYFFLTEDRVNPARRAYLNFAVPRSLRAADRVIAVSETAKKDTCELFGLDPAKVAAVHHACSPWAIEAAARFAREGVPPVPPPLDSERPYVLNVSSTYGLKNQRRLIEAFGLATGRSEFPHDLVIAGREADVSLEELRETAHAAGVAGRVQILGPYPQEHLPALLANATAVAYPSLYETFGHPVLEAFAFGRPLLTADVGGAAEIAGDGAIQVDPRSADAISEGLVRLLEDDPLRATLVRAGQERLRRFSWENSARGTARVLREAIEVH